MMPALPEAQEGAVQIGPRAFHVEPLDGSPTTETNIVRSWLQQGYGWIETHRELMPWRADDPLPLGTILQAELVLNETESLAIRYVDGVWIGTRFVEIDATDLSQVLVTSWLTTMPGAPNAPLVYHTWWAPRLHNDIQVLAPRASRLAAITLPSPVEG